MNSDMRGGGIDGAVRSCADAHRALVAQLAGLTDAAARQPSLLPGWSVGHVLTHIARNADGIARMAEGAQRGEVAAMYEHGMEGRSAAIEAGAGRPAAELVADVEAASTRLDAIFDQLDEDAWAGRGLTVFGELAVSELPTRRRFEVEVHRVDLGLGYTFADVPADFLRSELSRLTGQWASRKPMGFTDLPPAALALSPPDRLAWLLGRLTVEGLAPAGIF